MSSEEVAKQEFRTKDLNQAAFMWCQPGSKLVRLHKSEGKTIYFRFSLPLNETEIASLIIAYANGDTRVDPLAYSQNQSKLRDLLHIHLNNRD